MELLSCFKYSCLLQCSSCFDVIANFHTFQDSQVKPDLIAQAIEVKQIKLSIFLLENEYRQERGKGKSTKVLNCREC